MAIMETIALYNIWYAQIIAQITVFAIVWPVYVYVTLVTMEQIVLKSISPVPTIVQETGCVTDSLGFAHVI